MHKVRLIFGLWILLIAGLIYCQTSVKTAILLFSITSPTQDPESLLIATTLSTYLKDLLQKSERFEVMLFNPDLPSLKRALLEGYLETADLQAADVQSAIKIGRAVGIQVVIMGKLSGITEKRVEVTLQLIDTATQKVTELAAKSEAGKQQTARETLLEEMVRGAAEALFGQLDAKLGVPELDVDAATRHFALGNEYLSKGKYEEAILEYTYAIALEPKRADLYIAIGRAYIEKGEPENALRAFIAATLVDPENVDTHLLLGDLYLKLNQPDKAIAEYEALVKLTPPAPNVYVCLGKSYIAGRRFKEANEQFQIALKLEPKNIEAYMGLGDVASRWEQFEVAISNYQKAVQLKPDNLPGHQKLAQTYIKTAMYDKAIAELKILQESEPPKSYSVSEYLQILDIMDKEFKDIYNAKGKWENKFKTEEITVEELFLAHKDLYVRACRLAEFAEAVKAPEKYNKSHFHRLLAFNLLAQAYFQQLQFIDTRDSTFYNQASLNFKQAVRELNFAVSPK